jgi:hypothetical protein
LSQGINTIAIGVNAGNSSQGTQSIAVGWQAGYLSQGTNSVAIGTSAASSTQGNDSISIGNLAGKGQQGTHCIAMGYLAQYYQIGANNIAIGQNSGNQGGLTCNNTTCLGANSIATASNQVQLGDNLCTTYAYGAVQNRSDARDKTDIRNCALGLTFINQLRPVDYRWNYREAYIEYVESTQMLNETSIDPITREETITQVPKTVITRVVNPNDGSKTRRRYHHGLIAQEVKQVMTDMSVDFGGYQDHSLEGGQDTLSIGYDELIAPLIKSIQQLSAQVSALQAIISELTGSK